MTGIKYGERLYQESINRVQKQEAQLIALNLMEAQLKNKSKVTEKSHSIAQAKLEKDLDRVVYYVDHNESGQLSVRQLG